LSTSNDASVISTKKGEKDEQKLPFIEITLLIVGMIIASASAIVTPPTTIKDALFKGLWTAIMDLQNQITALTTKVNSIPASQACWDLNNNNLCDIASEDMSGDNSCTVLDCKGPKGDKGDTVQREQQGLLELRDRQDQRERQCILVKGRYLFLMTPMLFLITLAQKQIEL
jgi:hypothetical protein